MKLKEGETKACDAGKSYYIYNQKLVGYKFPM